MNAFVGDRPLRILHLPNDLGGHPRALAKAQRQLGHDAVCVSLDHSRLGFNGDESYGSPLGAPGRVLAREMARFRLLWRSLSWADVVHCHFGQTLLSVRAQPIADLSRHGLAERLTVAYARVLWLRDLGIWHMKGKRVAMTFYGDDVRMVDLSVARNPNSHLTLPGLREEFARRDIWKRKLVDMLEGKGVTMFVTNPDLLSALPEQAAFIPYGNVNPYLHRVMLPRQEGTLRFIHMPTHRDVKGTSMFVAAVDQLTREGVDCSLTLVEGVTNAQALAALLDHDVLLDQLRVGWYGAVAVEAMAMGKPAVAYLHPDDKQMVLPAFAADLPVVEASPSDVSSTLRKLANLPRAELATLGLASRTFVENWHCPETVARTVLSAYRAP